jgi:ribose 5-phosphate isomerase B
LYENFTQLLKYKGMSIVTPCKSIGMCSDHAGYELKSIIQGYLESQGLSYKDFGTHSRESCDYPDFAHPCAEAIESGECYPGIAMCGSGNGIGITLNKHQGIRAALCWTPELARLARQHNDANVLVLPARFIPAEVALEIVDAFLNTDFEGGRHERRVAKIPVKK